MAQPATRAPTHLHQIGEVAHAVGLSLRTIRYYEEVGIVLPSGRSAGGFRLYTDEDVERFRIVKAFKPLKITLEEMRDLIALLDRLAAGKALTADELRRLDAYAAAADHRSAQLREQVEAVESLAQLLARQSKSARRSTRR